MSLGSQVATICRVTPSGNPAAEGYEDQFSPLRPRRHCTDVATEMALHVLTYNLTRVINIMGPGPLIAAIKA